MSLCLTIEYNCRIMGRIQWRPSTQDGLLGRAYIWIHRITYERSGFDRLRQSWTSIDGME